MTSPTSAQGIYFFKKYWYLYGPFFRGRAFLEGRLLKGVFLEEAFLEEVRNTVEPGQIIVKWEELITFLSLADHLKICGLAMDLSFTKVITYKSRTIKIRTSNFKFRQGCV